MHPIITHGGSQVNVIPGEVRLETYVRGKTVEAILEANRPRGPRAARGRARARAPRWRSRPCPATCRSSTTWAWRSSFKANAAGAAGRRPGDRDRATAAAPPTWATSPTSCRRCIRTWAGPRQRARRRLRDRGPEARLRRAGQAARADGGGHAVGRRGRRARDPQGLEAAHDQGGVPRLPAEAPPGPSSTTAPRPERPASLLSEAEQEEVGDGHRQIVGRVRQDSRQQASRPFVRDCP